MGCELLELVYGRSMFLEFVYLAVRLVSIGTNVASLSLGDMLKFRLAFTLKTRSKQKRTALCKKQNLIRFAIRRINKQNWEGFCIAYVIKWTFIYFLWFQ